MEVRIIEQEAEVEIKGEQDELVRKTQKTNRSATKPTSRRENKQKRQPTPKTTKSVSRRPPRKKKSIWDIFLGK